METKYLIGIVIVIIAIVGAASLLGGSSKESI